MLIYNYFIFSLLPNSPTENKTVLDYWLFRNDSVFSSPDYISFTTMSFSVFSYFSPGYDTELERCDKGGILTLFQCPGYGPRTGNSFCNCSYHSSVPLFCFFFFFSHSNKVWGERGKTITSFKSTQGIAWWRKNLMLEWLSQLNVSWNRFEGTVPCWQNFIVRVLRWQKVKVEWKCRSKTFEV